MSGHQAGHIQQNPNILVDAFCLMTLQITGTKKYTIQPFNIDMDLQVQVLVCNGVQEAGEP